MNYFQIKQIITDWRPVIYDILNNNCGAKQTLVNKLQKDREANKTIYPNFDTTFSCFNLFNIDEIKVVILGQDPYHTPNKAMGLSFSVPSTEKVIPPSLKNIFKEIKNDIDNMHCIPSNGDLTKWAKQGVLLLNCALSVVQSVPNSHKKEWEFFSDAIIKYISDNCKDCVFLLWGAYAKNKKRLINCDLHYVLDAPHPSPFSAHLGFFGCKHFSKTNTFLKAKNKGEIDWLL